MDNGYQRLLKLLAYSKVKQLIVSPVVLYPRLYFPCRRVTWSGEDEEPTLCQAATLLAGIIVNTQNPNNLTQK